MMFSVTRTSRVWFSLSGLLMAATAVVLIFWGLNPGIDFSGGSILKLEGDGITVPRMREALVRLGESSAVVQTTGEGESIVRLRTLSTEEHARLLARLRETFPALEETQFDSVGPTLSRELLRKSVLAIILASLGILVYLAFVFRRTSSVVSPWSFGTIAVLALLHDAFIATGAFAVYARFWSASADSLFVTALLTTIGFSVHDTIVIFNRIAGNMRRLRLSFAQIVDVSVVETFTRSVNTSLTTLLVLLSLLFFGGDTTRPFIVALAAGVVIGTYSSVCVAAPLLVRWQEWKGRRSRR